MWRRSFTLYRSVSQTTTKPEIKLSDILKRHFPKANQIEVTDISGGCGAMFEVHIQSVEFCGLNKVKQHMIVNDVSSQ